MSKIRNKLSISFLFIALFAVTTIGGYALYTIKNVIRDLSIEKQAGRVSLISNSIEDFLETAMLDLTFLTETSTVKNLEESLSMQDGGKLSESKKNLELDLLNFSDQKRMYQKIRFVDNAGTELVRIDRTNEKSIVVKGEELQNISGTYYFKDTTTLEKSGIMVSSLELSRKNGEIEKPLQPTIRYATPIYDKSKILRGILVLDVKANDFLKILRNALHQKDSYFLLDKDGYYLFHPDPKKEWGSSVDLNTGENFLDDFDETSFNQIVSNKKLLKMEQKNYIVSTIPVFLNKAQTLTLGYLVGSASKDIVFAPAYYFRNIFLVVGFFVILISLALSVVLAGSITKPLVYLAKGAEEMSKGKIDTAIMVNSKDEIKTLADSIERLRKSVKFLVDRAKNK